MGGTPGKPRTCFPFSRVYICLGSCDARQCGDTNKQYKCATVYISLQPAVVYIRTQINRQLDLLQLAFSHCMKYVVHLYMHRIFSTNRFTDKLSVIAIPELPEKSIMLPPFVDSTHCLSYHLTRKGRSIADRVVSVLGYACPDITYSPSLYPIAAVLLHFMTGKQI